MTVISMWHIITTFFTAFVLERERNIFMKFRTCLQITVWALVGRGMGFFLLKRIDAG